jgi:peptidoglycan hydrolase-like protein with peptidoglycan-binding domain
MGDDNAVVGVVSARQPGAAPLTVFAAPATGDEFNTIGERLVPKGCFKVEDVLFDFGSSFIRPEIGRHLSQLADLRNEHKIRDPRTGEAVFPPLSIFGHADPVGEDADNKRLSGRRATAFYAMLVRDVDLWEQLFSNPVGQDNWGTRSIQAMLSRVQAPIGVTRGADEETRTAIKVFQSANGLPADGVAGPQTRSALFRAYMDALCGPDLQLDKEKHFLARGVDAGGKGDRQGCSEFNPLRMFSGSEAAAFERQADKTERNDENAPNRRVMALLFAPGRRVNPARWPCPRVDEGVAACKKRFFKDAATRRSFQAERRDFDATKDTFACRFYQLISDDSPCERVTPVITATYRIVVVDEFDTPLPGVSVTLAAASSGQTSPTNSVGVAEFIAASGGALVTVRNDKALADALAALVDKPPRDEQPLPRPGFAAITPSKTSTSIPVAAGSTHVIMIIARTDVVFELPQGWEDLEPSAPGPWQLSKSGSRAVLRLVSQGVGRSVTLRCPASDELPFSGTFPASPLWSPDRKRLLQPGETLASLAEKYLGDASEVDKLVALNPRLGATTSGVAATQAVPVTLPPDAIPGWLSIPKAVESEVGAIPEAVFATIDVDALHDALFRGDRDAVWDFLSALPRDPRSTSKLSAEHLLEIFTQSMLADLRAATET